MNRKCEYATSVSDADFGYWNSAWGDPGVQEFTCGKPGEVFLLQEFDNEFTVVLCPDHAAEANL